MTTTGRTTGADAARRVDVLLPEQLAPRLRLRAVALLHEVPLAHVPDEPVLALAPQRCAACLQPGKLVGHHAADGRVQLLHRSCHRRLHRSGRHDVGRVPRPLRRRRLVVVLP